jgi:membrane protein implicated in regulation of membrane protease activity
MSEWWNNLTPVNRAFFSAAAFFSVFFLWQMIAALIGLGDHDGAGDVHDGDFSHDGHMDDFEADAAHDSTATVVAFKMLSIRAIITFFTLFTWGSALYLNQGVSLSKAMGISSLWGLAGMASIALLLSLLPKMTDTGTRQIETALGRTATVYLDIPENSRGEIRVDVSGVVSYVKARSVDGSAIKSGTPVTVEKIIDSATVAVKTVEN